MIYDCWRDQLSPVSNLQSSLDFHHYAVLWGPPDLQELPACDSAIDITMATPIVLAKQILHHATALQSQLDKAKLPTPSLSADSPPRFPPSEDQPETHASRAALINLSRDLLLLALGPTDFLRSITNSGRADFAALQTIVHYDIPSQVPEAPGSISMSELATNLGVDYGSLDRILRHAFTIRLFCEPPEKPGHVAHTSVSLAVPALAPWIRLVVWEPTQAALAKIPEAMGPSSSIPDEVATTQRADTANEDTVTASTNHAQGDSDSQVPKWTPFQLANRGSTFFSKVQSSATAPEFQNSSPIGNVMNMRLFSAAMTSHAGVHPSSIYEQTTRFLAPLLAIPLPSNSQKTNTLVDLGGGNGHIAIQIARGFPDLNVIIQDLPSNRSAANQKIASVHDPALASRVKFSEQDFFKPQPDSLRPRAYYMRAILHDWNDEDCVRLLKNLVPKMMPLPAPQDGAKQEEGARVYVMDRILPDRSSATAPFPPAEDPLTADPDRPPTASPATPSRHIEALQRHMDILMFALLGAKERTLGQWRDLFHMADPRLQVLRWEVPVGCELGVLEVALVE